jgi:glucosamine-6-phosphate deaminase
MATSISPAARAAKLVPGTGIPCYQFESNGALSSHVARTIANLIRERNAVGQQAVLGLPTGSTPMGVYRELIRMHREEGLDFSNVVTFNLDEYYGLSDERPQNCRRWIHDHFLSHVNIPADQVHHLDGTVAMEEVDTICRQYEQKIQQAGGIDLQLLGIGRNGHIGFNEPFSVRQSRTRLARLDPLTRRDASESFFSEESVPALGLTMGIGTILEARKIMLMALGEHKSGIVREAVEGPMTDRVPASLLSEHVDVAFLVDPAAAGTLTGVATPWVLGNVQWTESLIKRALLWLSEQTGKALLKLDDNDFRDHNLHQLLRHHGPVPLVAHMVFRSMMETIEYHPAGRDSQRVLCFSPHPDDDVISMGGTLIRLVEDGHDVHIAYMTSGNIAVFDHDARQVADMVTEFNRLFGIDECKSQEVEAQVAEALMNKSPGERDSEAVAKIKALIRWSEAKSGAIACGCKEENLEFLDLPFYRTGKIAKNPVSDEDVRILCELIQRVDPGQIYVAGDLSDPHGTHRVCAEAIFLALQRIQEQGGRQPDVLLYRGAWQEWPIYQIEIAVPLSPSDLKRKKHAIFRHESQKDSAPFPGPDDPREFWQRAEQRNQGTAAFYNALGLPEFYALEAFVRWNGQPL